MRAARTSRLVWRSDPRCERPGLGHQPFRSDLSERESDLDRTRRGHPACGVENLGGRLRPDLKRQQEATRCLGNDSQGNERNLQTGALGDVGDVTVQEYGETEAHSDAIHGRDQRLLEFDDLLHAGCKRVFCAFRRSRHVREVHSGSEGARGAR